MIDISKSDGACGVLVDRHGFPATRWTELVHARNSTAARNRVMARYYRPARTYVLALCKNADEADDIVNGFFALELERLIDRSKGGVVRAADPERGRFRDLLRRSLWNYWVSTWRRRRGRQEEQLDDERWGRVAGNDKELPAQLFERAWVEGILAEALHRTEVRCQARNQMQHYRLMLAYHLPVGVASSWETLAQENGLPSGKDARNKAATAVRHYQQSIVEVVSEDVEMGAVRQEIGDLIERLGGGHG